jgi:DNA invertase Pin-like site-specific DNA recombinase
MKILTFVKSEQTIRPAKFKIRLHGVVTPFEKHMREKALKARVAAAAARGIKSVNQGAEE